MAAEDAYIVPSPFELRNAELVESLLVGRTLIGSSWLDGAHLLSFGVALVLVDEDERERFG